MKLFSIITSFDISMISSEIIVSLTEGIIRDFIDGFFSSLLP